MQYKTVDKNDSTDISKLSAKELGWASSHLESMLEKYPGSIALEDEKVRGAIYSEALSSDILRICNFVVDEDIRKQGVGTELLEHFEQEAADAGFKAILFPEDSEWFDEDSFLWLESQGYKSIYNSDKSRVVIKEMAEV